MNQNLCGKTREEISDMLFILQEICESNTCDSCPFSDGNGSCKLTDSSPDGWEIKNEGTIWRAMN